jgi:hypothetical protein
MPIENEYLLSSIVSIYFVMYKNILLPNSKCETLSPLETCRNVVGIHLCDTFCALGGAKQRDALLPLL